MPQSETSWHALNVQEAVNRIGAHGEAGLAVQEAQDRLAQYGRNVLPEGKKRTLPWAFSSPSTPVAML